MSLDRSERNRGGDARCDGDESKGKSRQEVPRVLAESVVFLVARLPHCEVLVLLVRSSPSVPGQSLSNAHPLVVGMLQWQRRGTI